jgi:hypothetical protein
VPQDIPLASHAKNILAGGESPKVDKPLSPSTKKSVQEKSKPPSPGNANGSAGAEGAPPSPTAADSRCDAARDSSRLDPTECSRAFS